MRTAPFEAEHMTAPDLFAAPPFSPCTKAVVHTWPPMRGRLNLRWCKPLDINCPDRGTIDGSRPFRDYPKSTQALAQPQHDFELPDHPSCRAEGLKAANPRHRPLDPEVMALYSLLQVLADVM